MRITRLERPLQFILWIALCLVLVEMVRQARGPEYRCLVTVHDEILCFQPDGALFRPEKRFNRFVLEDGEK